MALYTLLGFIQMTTWAKGKHRAYSREFKDYPSLRMAIIPLILWKWSNPEYGVGGRQTKCGLLQSITQHKFLYQQFDLELKLVEPDIPPSVLKEQFTNNENSVIICSPWTTSIYKTFCFVLFGGYFEHFKSLSTSVVKANGSFLNELFF